MSKDFWQNQVYSQQKHINRYPFDRVVSAVMPRISSLPKPLTALDLGSGTGNHLKFFAENGFDVTGVEQSETAASLSLRFLEAHHLSANLHIGDITKLDNLDINSKFSLILDRGSLTHNSLFDFNYSLSSISKYLKSQGVFISYFFSSNHSSVVGATEISPYYFSNYTRGDFVDCPAPALFLPQDQAIKLFSKYFTIISLVEFSSVNCTSGGQVSAMFECICTVY